jgi:hypothetical protein
LIDETIKKANNFAAESLSEPGGLEYEYTVEAYQILVEAMQQFVAIARPNERGELIATGRATCEKGLAINPNHPRRLLICGGLGVHEARRNHCRSRY